MKDFINDFVGDFNTNLKPKITCVQEDLFSKMYLSFEIEITGNIGNVKLPMMKIERNFKVPAELIVKILANDNNIELGEFFEKAKEKLLKENELEVT